MKNIIKKAGLLSILYYTAMGCQPCKCPLPISGKFKYTGIQAANILYVFNSGAPYNTAPTAADTVDKSRYGMQLQLAYDVVLNRKARSPSFCNAAYACSCRENEYTLTDSITHIDIITLDSFDVGHPAGSDMSDYFQQVIYDYGSRTISYMPLNSDRSRLNLQLAQKGDVALEFYFRNDANISTAVAFDVVLRHKSGRTLHTMPKPVYLR